MTTRREYVEGLLNERAFKIQKGASTADVDAELGRFSSGPLSEVIEAAVPGGLNKPRRTKKATAASPPPSDPDAGSDAGDQDGDDDDKGKD